MPKQIAVIVVPTAGAPAVTTIANTLDALQKEVGGYIEPVLPPIFLARGRSLVFYGNEDGRSLGLPSNPYFPGILGPIVIAAITSHGNPASLTADETSHATMLLRSFLDENNADDMVLRDGLAEETERHAS